METIVFFSFDSIRFFHHYLLKEAQACTFSCHQSCCCWTLWVCFCSCSQYNEPVLTLGSLSVCISRIITLTLFFPFTIAGTLLTISPGAALLPCDTKREREKKKSHQYHPTKSPLTVFVQLQTRNRPHAPSAPLSSWTRRCWRSTSSAARLPRKSGGQDAAAARDGAGPPDRWAAAVCFFPSSGSRVGWKWNWFGCKRNRISPDG